MTVKYVQELRKLALVFNLHKNNPSLTSPYLHIPSADIDTKPDYDHLGGLSLIFGLYLRKDVMLFGGKRKEGGKIFRHFIGPI